jgi:CBS domain-containing protein
MTTIATILKDKGTDIAAVGPATPVAEVAHTLADRRIGAVLVRDGDAVLGILSERDIVRALARHGAHTLDMTARELMTQELRTATPHVTVPQAMEIMTEGRFRHLPVMDGGKLVGIVSIGDIVKARIMETEHEVDSLKAYVAGAA